MTYAPLLTSPAFVADLADAGYLTYDNGRFQLTSQGKSTLDRLPPSKHDRSPLYLREKDGAYRPTHLGAFALLGELGSGEHKEVTHVQGNVPHRSE